MRSWSHRLICLFLALTILLPGSILSPTSLRASNDLKPVAQDYRQIFQDDFSQDKGWIDESMGFIKRDPSNQWLSWEVTREATRRYYVPIAAAADFVNLTFRFQVQGSGGDGCLYLGLVESLSGSMGASDDPTGFFVAIRHDTAAMDIAHPWITYADHEADQPSLSPTGSWDGVDPEEYLDLGAMNVWRQIKLVIDHGHWTLILYDDIGLQLDTMSGDMSSTHSGYPYLMLYYPGTGGWEWERGVLDDVTVYGTINNEQSTNAGAQLPSQETVTVPEIRPDQVTNLSLPGGPAVTLPDGALYDYDGASITFRYVTAPAAEPEASSYVVAGNTIELDLSNDDVFATPVTLVIPYDPSVLPTEVPEANVFVVFLQAGQWIRLPTAVDEQNNTLTVQTLHNGFWSWAYDTVANIEMAARQYMWLVDDQPGSVAEAEALVQQRYDEWMHSWRVCDIAVETYQEVVNIPELARQGLETYVLWAADAMAVGLGGEAAVLTIGGLTVAEWGGGFLTAIYVGRVAGATFLELRCLHLNMQAYVRLQEARAILESLRHSQQTSFSPEQAQYIEDWVRAQTENQSSSDSTTIDWSLTAHPDTEVEDAAEPAAPAVACTVRADRPYVQVRVGPGENRGVRSDLVVNEDVPVIGKAQDDAGIWWWKIQPPGYDEREADRYWVKESDVTASGDCDVVSDAPASPLILPPAPSTGGSGGGQGGTYDCYGIPVSFWADSYNLPPGGCTALHWDVDNISTVYINGNPTTGHNTEPSVCSDRTFTHHLRVTRRDGRVCNIPLTITVGGSSSSGGSEGIVLGTGEVQVTLSWDNNADMDLAVVEPSGEEINYGHRTSSTRGQLDVDSNYPCGEHLYRVENVFWPRNGAPSGSYRVYVREFSSCGYSTANWTLIVKVNGRVVLSQSGRGPAQFAFSA